MKLCITILKYHSWYLCQLRSLQIMLLPIQTVRTVTKLSKTQKITAQIVKRKEGMKLCITILKYHSWYLCQLRSLQIMLLPIQTVRTVTKLSKTQKITAQIVKRKEGMKLCITILKYHSWYLCQLRSLQIMLLPIQTVRTVTKLSKTQENNRSNS